MRTYPLFISVLFFLFSACNSEEIPVPISTNFQLAFSVEKTNTTSDYIAELRKFNLVKKQSSWQEMDDGRIQLLREISFKGVLENGAAIEFGLWFKKDGVDRGLLLLHDSNAGPWENKKWNYIDVEKEGIDFYQNFTEARVLVDNAVIFHTAPTQSFQFFSIIPLEVDGATKNQLTLMLDGKAFGWYDPLGQTQAAYQISNGLFIGIIE